MNSVKVIAALLILSTFFDSRAISMERSPFPAQNLSLNGNHVLSGIIPIPVNDALKLVSQENLMDAPYLFQSAQTDKKKLDSLITRTWNLTENKWTGEGNQRYEYDDKGRLIKYIWSKKDAYADKWDDSYKEEYIYESDNLIRYIDSYRDTITGAWIFDDKEEYSYDSNRYLIQYISYEWQVSTGLWIASAKAEFSYNTNGKVTQYTSYYNHPNTGLWIPSYKGEYSYNSSGKPTLYTGYSYGGSPGNWVADYKGEFSYDTGGRIEQYIDYYWNSSTKQWVAIGKDEFSYDANGFLVRTTEYYYDALKRQYVSERKQEYNYDVNSNISQYTEFYFNQTGGGWTYTFKEEYTYNNDYAYDDLIVPVIYKESNRLSFNHMRLSANSFLWDKISATWKNHKSNSFWYSEVIIPITELNTPPYIIKNIPDYEVYAGKTLAIFISSTPGELFGDDNTGDSLTITVSLADGVPLPSFMSFKDDTLFAKPLDTDIGCYTIFVKATDLKGAFVNLSFEICAKSSATGIIAEINELFDVSVYPNPSKSNVIIDLSHNPGEPFLLQVINAGGQIVKQQILMNHHTMVDLTGHPAEIYLFRILSRNSAITKKIIIY